MKIKKTALLICLILLTGSIYAETRLAQIVKRSGIVENDMVRKNLMARMLESAAEIVGAEDRYSYAGYPTSVKFKTIVEPQAVYFLFINETNKKYPEAAKGNFLIKRNRATGRFEYIKIFYRNEKLCYILVTPHGKRTVMDILLFGRKIYHDISLPFSVEDLLAAPFLTILELSAGSVDWETLLFQGRRIEDEKTEEIVARIISELPSIREVPDGAIDNQGKFVAIETGERLVGPSGLNCSGFMKWIIDGFFFPATGRLSDIAELKKKHPDARGTRWTERIEGTRDPFFGLDWTRNCAITLAQAQSHRGLADVESRDVRSVPFFPYLEDAGYRVNDLELILFFLAVNEPGTAYLGAVNDIYQKKPLYVEYYHVVTFFPFFNKRGEFEIVVMDQHKDFRIESFTTKYADQYIHLVRINSDSEFSPLHIE